MAPPLLSRPLFPLFSATPPADPGPQPEDPAPNTIRLVDSDGADRPRCLISALGPDLPGREELLLSVAERIAAEGKRPVICATHLSLPFLADAPVAVELLPTRSDLRLLTAPEYAAYLRRRHEVLLAKWAVTEAIALGEEFEEFLARESEMPQSETPPGSGGVS